MGKQILILIMALIIVCSSIIISLNKRQASSTDELADDQYATSSRHVANSFTNMLIRDISNYYKISQENEGNFIGMDDQFNILKPQEGTLNLPTVSNPYVNTNVLDIDNSTIKIWVEDTQVASNKNFFQNLLASLFGGGLHAQDFNFHLDASNQAQSHATIEYDEYDVNGNLVGTPLIPNNGGNFQVSGSVGVDSSNSSTSDNYYQGNLVATPSDPDNNGQWVGNLTLTPGTDNSNSSTSDNYWQGNLNVTHSDPDNNGQWVGNLTLTPGTDDGGNPIPNGKYNKYEYKIIAEATINNPGGSVYTSRTEVVIEGYLTSPSGEMGSELPVEDAVIEPKPVPPEGGQLVHFASSWNNTPNAVKYGYASTFQNASPNSVANPITMTFDKKTVLSFDSDIRLVGRIDFPLILFATGNILLESDGITAGPNLRPMDVQIVTDKQIILNGSLVNKNPEIGVQMFARLGYASTSNRYPIDTAGKRIDNLGSGWDPDRHSSAAMLAYSYAEEDPDGNVDLGSGSASEPPAPDEPAIVAKTRLVSWYEIPTRITRLK